MKPVWTTTVMMGLLSLCGAAQTSQNHVAGLAKGIYLNAQFSKTVDAKNANAGDEVTARVTNKVRFEGKIVLRKGAKLIGHVTEVHASTRENPESKVGIAFDKIVLQDGQEMPINGAIRMLAPRTRPEQPSSLGISMGSSLQDRMYPSRLRDMALSPGVIPDLRVAEHTNTRKSFPTASGTMHRTEIQGLFLGSAISGGKKVSIIMSPKGNVKLKKGFRIGVLANGQ